MHTYWCVYMTTLIEIFNYYSHKFHGHLQYYEDDSEGEQEAIESCRDIIKNELEEDRPRGYHTQTLENLASDIGVKRIGSKIDPKVIFSIDDLIQEETPDVCHQVLTESMHLHDDLANITADYITYL